MMMLMLALVLYPMMVESLYYGPGSLQLQKFQVRVCEGGVQAIHCPKNKGIHIIDANYGRTTGDHICPHPLIHSTNCYALGSLQEVRNDCDDKQNCVLYANNRKFGDPCFGTYKYLEVHYSCIDAKYKKFQVRVCEYGVHKIYCPSSKRIHIIEANYGRTTGGHICPHPSIHSTNCYAGRSLQEVRNDCDGKQNCVLYANNSKFGDPCFGTYKYLEVRYACL